MDYGTLGSALFSVVLYGPILIALTFIVIYMTFALKKIWQWKQSNIPFLLPIPLIGNRHFLNMRKYIVSVPFHHIYEENCDKDLIAFFMTTLPVILLRDPKLIRKIYSGNFNKTLVTGFAMSKDEIELQSSVLFASNYDTWSQGRKFHSPWFQKSSIKDQDFSKFKELIDRTLRRIMEAEKNGHPIDVKKITYSLMVDSTSAFYFNEDTDSYHEEGTVKELVDCVLEESFWRAFCLLLLMQFPALEAFESFRMIPRKVVDSVSRLLRRKMETNDGYGGNDIDFVNHLTSPVKRCTLNSQNLSDEEVHFTKISKDLSFKEAVGGALMMGLATAHTGEFVATGVIHYLSLHPEYQERILEEVKEEMEKYGVSEITLQVAKDLKFTEQCLLETLRILPLLPFSMRVCTEDFQVPGTQYRLKKGDRLIFDSTSIQRDPKYFKNPYKFDPDRFSPQNLNSITQDAFVAFGVGPRKCPGQQVGLLRTTIFIASLLSEYKLKPRSHQKQVELTDLNPASWLHSIKGELLVDAIPRKKAAF